MSPAPTARLLARGLLRQSTAMTAMTATTATTTWSRPFSNTVALPSISTVFQGYAADIVQQSLGPAAIPRQSAVSSLGAEGGEESKKGPETLVDYKKPFKFSVYAAKQNTHITVCQPNGKAIISLSCGNIGFRKAGRKKYDSAYQLAAFVIDQLYRDGWHEKMNAIELTLRGFGQGREAVSKALCGYEGRHIKDKFISVADSSRLKFGGTKSRNPRRLG